MAISNDNTQTNPSLDPNQTEVKIEKNKSPLVFIVALVLLITVVIWGLYIFHTQTNRAEENESNSIVVPTLDTDTTLYEMKLFSIPVYYWTESTEPMSTLQVMAPSQSILSESERYGLPAQILSFLDGSSLVFFAEHGGGIPITFDLNNLTKIETDNYGTIYRYDNNGINSYVKVQTEGVCIETSDGNIVAPCGYPSSGIQCESETGDYSTCDESIKTLSGMEGSGFLGF